MKRGERGSKYDGVIAELKANPGREAMVMTNVNSASARIFRDNGLTVKTRSTGDSRKVDVYAVYNGPVYNGPADEQETEAATDAAAPASPVKARRKSAPRPKASKKS